MQRPIRRKRCLLSLSLFSVFLFLFADMIGSCRGQQQQHQQERTRTTTRGGEQEGGGGGRRRRVTRAAATTTTVAKKSFFRLVQRRDNKDHGRKVAAEQTTTTNHNHHDEDAVILSSSSSPYIINGMPVVVDQEDEEKDAFPFFVHSYTNGNSALCGGTLIHSDIILTSAHCHGAFNQGLLLRGTGKGGSNTAVPQPQQSMQQDSTEDDNDNDNNNFQQFVQINFQRPHPGFSARPDLINDDIMVLRLETPIAGADATATAVVTLNNDPSIPADYQSCRVIGHGRTKRQQNNDNNDSINAAAPSKELLQTDLQVLPHKECVDALSSFDNIIVKDDILCATSNNNNNANNNNKTTNDASICQGDSGGPLLLLVNHTTTMNTKNASAQQQQQQMIQVGITSFSEECRAYPVPNGFTRVSTFYDWIQEQICDISVDPPTSCPPVPVNNNNNSTSQVVEEEEEGGDGIIIIIPVEIVFQHDANPDETTWSIRDRNNDNIVFAGPEYVAQPGDEWSTTVYLPLGRYFMEVFDSGGDGLDWPASIVIQTVETKEYPTSRILMDESLGGTFVGARLQLPFVVVDPNAPTSAPSSAPSKMILPTISPAPSMTPTPAPTAHPTITPSPTEQPTLFPTVVTLTLAPSDLPTVRPPTDAPSVAPSFLPSTAPSLSAAPTTDTKQPTRSPYPTVVPTEAEEPTPLFPTDPPSSRAIEPVAELSSEPTSGAFSSLSIHHYWMAISSLCWFIVLL